MAFINANKDDVLVGRRLGVERIRSVLQVAPSTYYAANGRPASARQIRDAEAAPRLLELWESNYPVYGARTLWKAAQRGGINIGRDQVARLMKTLGVEDQKVAKSKNPAISGGISRIHVDQFPISYALVSDKSMMVGLTVSRFMT